ncbi:multicopper oxidase family protein [Aquabacterium sp.]|uniref:multicopper oxidase family protein n=1 Tax=Aquabacterium sp. TaxID=1872578 RepID=UPI002BE2A740|nr:copper oxidase [Aquabacterium sp.]HSW08680.1 copper oxidase [Aquabacterium sp.]
MNPRRNFLRNAGATALGAAAVSRGALAALPEAASQASPATQPPAAPPSGRPFNPVVTLNGWSLPWRMNQGVKEFHLVAEPVVREFAPGMKARLWGYNGSSPGPTIEAVEGDRVRIFVTNRLPEPTSVHWHGILLPSGMDGVTGLTQGPIAPGKTYVYEFVLSKSGTHMYHPHADEMLQMAMGMMGLFIVHPKDVRQHKVDRDFAFLLAAYDIEPGSATPQVNTMLDFNLWSWNSRVYPGIDPLVARTGDRVRIRVGNLTMTNHPMHLHGHTFEVTGTDGGWVPKSARWPEVTTDVAVGQMRAFEFDAVAGDWAFHCHKSHHTMNAMGHDVPTMIGVDARGVIDKITKLVPDYMHMGDKGMHEMAEMEMPLPDNTLPMMTGTGPFGAVGMGGMFSVLKVRDDVKPGDYRDPGWFKQPPGTGAYEFSGEPAPPVRSPSPKADAGTGTARKPGGHKGHH